MDDNIDGHSMAGVSVTSDVGAAIASSGAGARNTLALVASDIGHFGDMTVYLCFFVCS